MIRKFALMAALTGTLMAATAPAALAGPDEYLGEILTVGFNFCPRGTLEADGSLLPINENTALFSLLGTTYGGDGRTSFALPDLRGGSQSSGKAPAPASDETGAPAGSAMPPYLALKHCVVIQGIYPSRN